MSNIFQKPKYIIEIVQDQYIKWNNEFIVFDAPTSSGKTYFILNILCKYAKESGKRVLYLCNRKQLRIDIERAVKNMGYIHVRVLSYQTLQKCLMQSENFSGYGYIIFDEIHYLTSDSFNGYTDVTYRFMMKQKNNISILMSATAKPLFHSLLNMKKVKTKNYYTIEKDYSFVEHVYLYKSDSLTALIDGILETKPNDKILVFCNSEKRMLEMYDTYKDIADYYCSIKNNRNKKLVEICNENAIKHYDKNYITFDKPILFSTKALDNGIDLKDITIKHIFTEIFDIDSMIQTLGRKRSLNPEDTCDYYIKNYTPQGIACFEHNIKKQLEPIQLLKENPDKFYNKYGEGKQRNKLKNLKCLYMNFKKKGNANNEVRTNSDIRINNMMYIKFSLDYDEIVKMISSDYKTVISYWLGNELASKIINLEIEPIKRDLFLEYLDNIKGKYLFKEEQKELKNEFEKIGLRDRTMGINTLNGKLKDIKYPYIIKSGRDKRRNLEDGTENPNRDKTYWTIESNND